MPMSTKMVNEKLVTIKNGSVFIQDVITTKEISIGAFVKQIRAGADLNTGILPNDVIHISESNSKVLIVVVKKPTVMPMHTEVRFGSSAPALIDKEILTRFVSVPYLYFFIVLSKPNEMVKTIGVYGSKSPVASMNKELFSAPIPNQHTPGTDTQYMCTGDISVNIKSKRGDKVNSIMDQIFTTKYNDDLQIAGNNMFETSFYVDEEGKLKEHKYSAQDTARLSTNTYINVMALETQFNSLVSLKVKYVRAGTFKEIAEVALGVARTKQRGNKWI